MKKGNPNQVLIFPTTTPLIQQVIYHTMLQSHLWCLPRRSKQCLQNEASLITTVTPTSLPIHPIINPLKAELNPICRLLALLGGATIVVISRLRVNFTTTINTTHIQLLICHCQQLLIGITRLYSLTSHKAVTLIKQFISRGK